MLNDIRLTADQLAVLRRAAERAGGELKSAYPGRHAGLGGHDTCLGLGAVDAEDLAVFMAVVDTHDRPLGGILRTREVSDLAAPGVARTYYWPGILAAGSGEPAPAMLKVAGKRFACERCGATVFTRTGEVFACNGCGTEYAEPAKVVTS